MDWRDLRIALAVDRHGTLTAAGAALGIDPTTVSRRIGALEEALGVSLFRRGSDGWSPTEAGLRMLAHAARMAEEVRALAHDVDLAVARVEGTVRLTMLDEVASWFLAPHVGALRIRHPELALELICTEKVLDLARGRADIALRLMRPTEAGMRVRRLGTVAIGLFGAPAFLARTPVPSLPSEAEVDIVTLGPIDRPVPELKWVRSLLPRARVVVSTNSLPTAHELVRRGVGLGVLAVPSATAAGLIRLDGGVVPVSRPLWRVVPDSLADAPRIKAVLEWLDTLPTA